MHALIKSAWYALWGGLLWGTESCATYYERHEAFNKAFENGQLEQADRLLAAYKKPTEKSYRLVYYLDRGIVKHLLGQYEESNAFFEKAYIFGEDYKRRVGDEALSLLNPNLSLYYGEDHEHILPLYYKALNYAQQGNIQAALVEGRRLNIRLQSLADKYRSEKKYRRDAFIHLLMGLFYEAEGDINNAFIAYRNAYEIYNEDYLPLFGTPAPKQLKLDLLRTAAANGFEEERLRYEEEMQLQTPPAAAEGTGTLYFFWNNGLGPIKDETSITFALVKGQGGVIYFENEGEGILLPFPVTSSQAAQLSDLQTLRITFPEYIERPSVFDRAQLLYADSLSVALELAEPVTKIAFKCLSERLFWELSRSLLRVALREVAEQQLRQKDKTLGLIVDLVGTATESSDTRSWQTLPSAIHYARIPLPAGKQRLIVHLGRATGFSIQDTLYFDVQAGSAHFYAFTSLETR